MNLSLNECIKKTKINYHIKFIKKKNKKCKNELR